MGVIQLIKYRLDYWVNKSFLNSIQKYSSNWILVLLYRFSILSDLRCRVVMFFYLIEDVSLKRELN